MTSNDMIRRYAIAMGATPAQAASLRIEGRGDLNAAFPVTPLAAAAIAVAALSVSEYIGAHTGETPSTMVDRRLASFWFGTSLRPQGWMPPPIRDPISGDYATKDGWIRLHTNANHHRDAALRVLGAQITKQSVSHAVAQWRATDLESAIVEAGGCAAAMRTLEEWAVHPQGRAVSAEPIFHVSPGSAAHDALAMADTRRPLRGLKVLDLTRVLAGPVATRFLAAYGAQVLRIDPPFWQEPGMVPEVTPGKRCAVIQLKDKSGFNKLASLLSQADVLVHGYRADALARMGLDENERQRIRPGLVDVCLNAYGWSGPWRDRRGFDSLVQMSSGIADAGMKAFRENRPTPLPVQALDQTTGYLMATAVLRGLVQRLRTGCGSAMRLSLARSGILLASEALEAPLPMRPEGPNDLAPEIEHTDWGPARRLRPPCTIAGARFYWSSPAQALGSAHAQWQDATEGE